MEFRTENGTQIPISGLDDNLAITVAINNGSSGAEGGPEGSGTGGVPTAGAVNISHCDSVIINISRGNTNKQAGLFVQLNFTTLEGEHSPLSHRYIFNNVYICVCVCVNGYDYSTFVSIQMCCKKKKKLAKKNA